MNALQSNNMALKIVPNPTNGQFFVTLGSNHIDKIEVYNSLGEKVTEINNAQTVNLSNYSPGIYFVRVFSGNKVYSSKALKG